MTPQDLVLALFAATSDYDADAAKALSASDYIQQSTCTAAGPDGLDYLITVAEKIGVVITTRPVLAKRDDVVAHNTSETSVAFGADEIAAFDVFRIEGGKDATHWATIGAFPKEMVRNDRKS